MARIGAESGAAGADFPAREREITKQWMADMWPLVIPSTFDATSMMDVDSDFSIGGQPIDGLRPPQPMEDLRRACTQMLALLDGLDKSAKKQMLGQWVREVCGSGLPAHGQALLIGEFALQVRDLEPSEVAESAWRLCLDGLAGIAQSLPRDLVLNGLLQQIAGAFPVLRTVRYPNNPMIAIAECCHRMGTGGIPGGGVGALPDRGVSDGRESGTGREGLLSCLRQFAPVHQAGDRGRR